MSKKNKNPPFSFKTTVRLVIFILIIYFSINFLSHRQSNLNNTLVLGDQTTNNLVNDLYQKLPSSSRHQLENFNQIPIVNSIEKQLNGFPNRQIKEIQKTIIQKISENMIKNIDNN